MTLEELRQYILGALDKAIGIRDEQRMMANTAKRVGGDLVDIVEILRTLFSDYLDQALRTFDDVEFQKLVLRESFKTADFIPGLLGVGTGMVGTEDFTTGKLTVRNGGDGSRHRTGILAWRARRVFSIRNEGQQGRGI